MLRPEEEEVTGLETTPKEHLCQRWKEGRLLVRLLKQNQWEVFRKDSEIFQATRQAYFKMYCPDYDHEGSHDLSCIFQEMATSAGLMGSEVHEVHDVWTG